jgi:hypothetical protein
MLEHATRVCNAEFGAMLLQEDGAFRHVALYNVSSAFVELIGRDPVVHPPSDHPLDRLARTRQPVHVSDLRDEPSYLRGFLVPVPAEGRDPLTTSELQHVNPVRNSI